MATAPVVPPAAPVPPARPPATPASPVATPTPIGRRGQMTFRLQRLPEPLLLEQVVLDPTWNWFKTIMVFVGGILFLLFLGGGMFFVGWNLNAPASPVMAPVAVTQPATAPSAATSVATPVSAPVQQNTVPPLQQPQWNSYADCQRHYVLTLGQDPEGVCDSLR